MTKLFMSLIIGITTVQASASQLGDEFARIGEKIDNSSGLTADQFQKLQDLIEEAENIIDNTTTSPFACIGGHYFGPNNLKVWTGSSNTCDDSSMYKIGKKYACMGGHLYNLKGEDLKWLGSDKACSDPASLKIGTNFACANGTIFSIDGSSTWTGNSSCANVKLD